MSKNKYIESPERLWELFEAYVKQEADNPMYKTEYVGKEGVQVRTPLETPITFEGFECYLEDKGVIQDLGDYASNKDGNYKEYSTIITRIRRNCFVHNFKGAAVGLFNANIIAKKLGLVEKTDSKVESVVTGKVVIVKPTTTEIPFAKRETDVDTGNS